MVHVRVREGVHNRAAQTGNYADIRHRLKAPHRSRAISLLQGRRFGLPDIGHAIGECMHTPPAFANHLAQDRKGYQMPELHPLGRLRHITSTRSS